MRKWSTTRWRTFGVFRPLVHDLAFILLYLGKEFTAHGVCHRQLVDGTRSL